MWNSRQGVGLSSHMHVHHWRSKEFFSQIVKNNLDFNEKKIRICITFGAAVERLSLRKKSESAARLIEAANTCIESQFTKATCLADWLAGSVNRLGFILPNKQGRCLLKLDDWFWLNQTTPEICNCLFFFLLKSGSVKPSIKNKYNNKIYSLFCILRLRRSTAKTLQWQLFWIRWIS